MRWRHIQDPTLVENAEFEEFAIQPTEENPQITQITQRESLKTQLYPSEQAVFELWYSQLVYFLNSMTQMETTLDK